MNKIPIYYFSTFSLYLSGLRIYDLFFALIFNEFTPLEFLLTFVTVCQETNT